MERLRTPLLPPPAPRPPLWFPVLVFVLLGVLPLMGLLLWPWFPR